MKHIIPSNDSEWLVMGLMMPLIAPSHQDAWFAARRLADYVAGGIKPDVLHHRRRQADALLFGYHDYPLDGLRPSFCRDLRELAEDIRRNLAAGGDGGFSGPTSGGRLGRS